MYYTKKEGLLQPLSKNIYATRHAILTE